MKTPHGRDRETERAPAPDSPAGAPGQNLFYEAIIDTLRELSEILSPDQILKTIVHNTGRTLKADRCSFVLVNEKRQQARVVVAYENRKVKGLALNLDTYPELNRAIATRAEVVISDMRRDPLLVEVRKAHPELASGSLLVLPVYARPKKAETFFLRIRRLSRPFTREEIDFARKIGFVSTDALLKAYRLSTLKKDIERGEEERRQIEESVKKYRTLIEGAPWGIFIYQDGAIQFANRKFRRIAGLKRADHPALHQLLTAESSKIVEFELGCLLDGQKTAVFTQIRGHGKGDAEIYWNLEAGLIEYQGRPAVECIVKDITYIKELEGRLEQKNLALQTAVNQLHELNEHLLTAKDELQDKNTELVALYRRLKKAHADKTKFLRLLSHELKNPLGVIRDYFGLLLDGLFGPLAPEQAEVIEESAALSRQILDMINSLLDYSKIEAGKIKYNFEAQDLIAVVDGVLSVFRHQARTRGVNIERSVSGELPLVRLDAERMAIVLKNLIDNALKHTPSGGSVEVIIRPFTGACPTRARLLLQPYVEISIQDTGPGIPEEYSEEVFAEFFQVPQAKERSKGAGIGLYIVREIVQHHQGDIWVDRAYRAGAKFTVVLPSAINESICPLDLIQAG